MSKCISVILELSPDDGSKKLDKIIDYLISYIVDDESLKIHAFPFLGEKLPKRPGEFVGALKKFVPVFWALDESVKISLDVLDSESEEKLLFLITDKKLPDYRIRKSIKKVAEEKIPFYIFSFVEQIYYENSNIIIIDQPIEFYNKSKELIYG